MKSYRELKEQIKNTKDTYSKKNKKSGHVEVMPTINDGQKGIVTTTKNEEVLHEKSVSKSQQRFFGMVRATQKGETKAPSSEVARVASSIKKSDAKDFASTKHKGLPEKKKMNEEGYDHYRDNILMKGGDHRSKETKNKSYTPSKPMKGKTAAQKAAKGKSALDIVKANIRKQYGKGAIMGEDVN